MDFTAKQLLWGMLFGQLYLHTKKICKQDTHELKKNKIVLVWAGIELAFFLVGGMVPCFGFATKTVLITH